MTRRIVTTDPSFIPLTIEEVIANIDASVETVGDVDLTDQFWSPARKRGYMHETSMSCDRQRQAAFRALTIERNRGVRIKQAVRMAA